MNFIFRLGLVLNISLLSIPFFPQTRDVQFADTDQLIEQAKQYHDSGNYDKAIHLLNRVSISDPQYALACYETALSLYYAGKTESALAKCREADFLNFEGPVLPGLEGSILDDLGRPSEGISILEKAVTKWPYNQNLLYNLGACYLNAGLPQKAEQVLCRSLICNPYHAGSNLVLARANYVMGRIAQAHLGFQMAILLNPSLKVIGEYENIISGKSRLIPRGYLYPYSGNYNHDQWDYLKSLIQSEVAFNDASGYTYSPNYTVTREAFLLFSNVMPDDRDTTVYNRLYAGLFSRIREEGYLETCIYYLMKNTSDEAVGKWIGSNNDKINSFIEMAKGYLNKGRKYGFSSAMSTSGKSYYQFNDDGDLASIGFVTEPDNFKSGKWTLINSNGSIDESGYYSDNKPEGEYLLFWAGGEVRQRLNFNQGLLHGTCYTYYPNGSLEGIYQFRNGEKNGDEHTYTSSGLPETNYTFQRDTMEGNGTVAFYPDGFKRNFTYKKGKLEGIETETWLNGARRMETSFIRGELNGEYTTWYANGQKEQVTHYVKGTKTGKWEKYNFNGKLAETGEYGNDGKLTGSYLDYDNRGNLVTRQEFYNQGMLEGVFISYFPDGQIQNVKTYKQDTLISVESFDGKGNLLHQSALENHMIRFKSYYQDGILFSEGNFYNGMQHGSWKYYNPLGIITQELNYMMNLQQGHQKTYYANGKVHEEYDCDSANIIGPYKEYFISGKLKSSGNYSKEGRDGEWLTWYVNDSIESRTFYSKGKTSGRSISYAPDGSVESQVFYNSNDKSVRFLLFDQGNTPDADWDFRYGTFRGERRYRNGILRQLAQIKDNEYDSIQEAYFPNGQIASRHPYIHGKINGTVIYREYTGELAGEYNYLMGQPDGIWKWYENGKLYSTSVYENGVMQGKSIRYYENGKIRSEVDYDRDKRNGYADYYAMDGTFMYRLRLVDNELKGYTWKDQAGNFVKEKPVTMTTTEIVCTYPNGKECVRIALKNGLYHGKFRAYYANGNIMREARFVDDDDEGPDRSYFPNGKVWEEFTCTGDERYGPYCLYYENGLRRLEGNYLDGLRDGTWHSYDKTGKVVSTLIYHYGTLYEIRNE